MEAYNMFRASLCPSSGAHDHSVGYHIGRLVLELLLDGSLQHVSGIIMSIVRSSRRKRWLPHRPSGSRVAAGWKLTTCFGHHYVHRQELTTKALVTA